MKKFKSVLVLFVFAVSLSLIGQAEAGQAKIFADRVTSQVLGNKGITPDVTSPADLTLDSKGRAVAFFPTRKVKGITHLAGGLSLRRGNTLVQIRGLQLRGKVIRGRLAGKQRPILNLVSSRKVGNRVTFKAARLNAEAARILRQTFTDSVFRRGMRLFESGRIPLS